MKMTIRNKLETYEICFERITQLAGINFHLKKFIIESLVKHFSNYRYSLYDNYMKDNVTINNTVPNRSRFRVVHISSREDVIDLLKTTKKTLMSEYIRSLMNEYPIIKEFEKVFEFLDKVFLEINISNKELFSNIELSYNQKKVLEIIENMQVTVSDERELEELTTIELINEMLSLLNYISENKAQRILIIFENIDHLIYPDEYVALMDKLKSICSEKSIWTIITSSIEKYITLNSKMIKGVNVINDIIFILPEIEIIKSFIGIR